MNFSIKNLVIALSALSSLFSATPAFAQGLNCIQKVQIAVQEWLPSREEYDVLTPNLVEPAAGEEILDNTQLWEVIVDSGIDGGGKSAIYVVTRGEGSSACILLGLFDPAR